jgi:hypothetical protein
MIRPADLALTPERREDAIHEMAVAMRSILGPEWIKYEGGSGLAIHALAALRDAGFIVLHEDDVTVETEYINDKTRHVFSRGDGGLYTHVRATITTGWRVPDA